MPSTPRTERKTRLRRGPPWTNLWLVEDNSATADRRLKPEARIREAPPVTIRLHRISGRGVDTVAEVEYESGSLRKSVGGRASIALDLLKGRRAFRTRSLIVAGTSYGCNESFVKGVIALGFRLVVEKRPSAHVHLVTRRGSSDRVVRASDLLESAQWRVHRVKLPQQEDVVPCRAAILSAVQLDDGLRGTLFAADVGAVSGTHRGNVICLTNADAAPMHELIRAVWWTRSIRPYMRRRERSPRKSAALIRSTGADRQPRSVHFRSNITLAQLQDRRRGQQPAERTFTRAILTPKSSVVNVVELFAGAGGMGLGFLMAKSPQHRFRLIFSGEIEPIYLQTLEQNHAAFATGRHGDRKDLVPCDAVPINLTLRRSQQTVQKAAREAGGADVLIGGPPCQGFSNANRNSWYLDNPNNNLVSVFAQYVEELRPKVFLMENVQGIAWTARNGRTCQPPSVADHVLMRMGRAGYTVFPKLLDAVWYGVPQYRTRFFVLGIHKDLGYTMDDFGDWGPFPRPTHGPGAKQPYVTVRRAIGDLPAIGNGHLADEVAYPEHAARKVRSTAFLALMRSRAPRGIIHDHVTSRHADYVIDRYRKIPPGGNWQDIIETMTNYADVSRTHSNIYRRLQWDKPAITIGHYRKSMLVHPTQHRGLSLREACRLQSFPDWFRFAGTEDGSPGGLMHKQQQLANAVCPLVSKAIGEFVLRL